MLSKKIFPGKLHSIAKAIGAPAETIHRLDDIRARLDEQRGPVLTEKNYVVIRTILMTDVWSQVWNCPRCQSSPDRGSGEQLPIALPKI